jgi:hypothetical protein
VHAKLPKEPIATAAQIRADAEKYVTPFGRRRLRPAVVVAAASSRCPSTFDPVVVVVVVVDAS